ncbi:MAG TPA: hypothetical protein VI911_04100 [Patescibacteria group bacterium]|nr:hypothetical protein [Patescibacteria group bacterium]
MSDNTLAALIDYARANRLPLELLYHPDADPGDGSGWAVTLGDRTMYGALDEAAGRLLDGREHNDLPGVTR